MKRTNYAVLIWIAVLSFILFIFANPLLAQDTLSQQPYYVIVGGFASHDNAERFTARLLAQRYPARYALNVNRKLYYVYVRLTADQQSAQQLAHRLRVDTEFQDAWIYTGALEGNGLLEDAVLADAHRVLEPVSLVERPAEAEAPAPVVTSTVVIGPTAMTTQASAAAGKRFVFRLTNAADHQPIDGVVYILQSEPDAHFRTCHANEEIWIPTPESGKLIVVCNLMGYKLAKRAFNYADPVKSIKGVSMGDAEEVIVPIKLVPMKKGDYMELEHVKFVDNSAILTPASEPELMALTSLMANPRRKIKLYGHTHRGSAKELSYQRAETVKAYLISQGIDASRISTKGYGAKLAIYEHASANERIEVQITQN